MPLRRVAQVLIAIWQALRSIQQGITTIMAQLSQLSTAYAALAVATTAALASLSEMQQQHLDDVGKLAEFAKTSDDAAMISLAADMQARAEKIQDAITALHTDVKVGGDQAKALGPEPAEPTAAAAAEPAAAAEASAAAIEPTPGAAKAS